METVSDQPRRVSRRLALGQGSSWGAALAALGTLATTAACSSPDVGNAVRRGLMGRRPEEITVAITSEHLVPVLEVAARTASERSWGQFELRLHPLPAPPLRPAASADQPPPLAFESPVLPALRAALGVSPDQAAAFGEAPADIVQLTGAGDFPMLLAEGLLQPLDPLAEAPGETTRAALDGFAPGALEALRARGALYGLPLSVAPEVLAYDPRLFDAAGVTRPDRRPAGTWAWPAFLDAARRLTRDSDGDGAPDDYGLFDLGSLATWVWQAGGEVVSADGRRALVGERAAV
ncbi:MAG: ABC transporter substrate-binding protein, partial [Chloroflexota bacterium]